MQANLLAGTRGIEKRNQRCGFPYAEDFAVFIPDLANLRRNALAAQCQRYGFETHNRSRKRIVRFEIKRGRDFNLLESLGCCKAVAFGHDESYSYSKRRYESRQRLTGTDSRLRRRCAVSRRFDDAPFYVCFVQQARQQLKLARILRDLIHKNV